MRPVRPPKVGKPLADSESPGLGFWILDFGLKSWR